MSHVTWHMFSFENLARIGASAVGTCMTMIFRTVSHRSSGLAMSLDGALEAFTFGNCSSIDVISCCKDVSLDFLSNLILAGIVKSELFYKSFYSYTSFIEVAFLRFVDQFLSDLAESNLN